MTTTGLPRRLVIAVVDDDRSVLESLEMLLASAEYDVRSCSAATALLESGTLREIDCLISDVGMPVMDVSNSHE
jgi:FixJ family two-component response regulator